MKPDESPNTAAGSQPQLQRRFGLLQASALNMTNMMGVGPFITIPLLMSTMGGGPQAMIGWLVALLIVIPDGLIWSELGAKMPGSGGSYLYLREAFGRETFGRLMAFLFIWQFMLSGPMEIASGYIGFSGYMGYLWPGITAFQTKLVAVALGVFTILLLYRKIGSIGKITVSLWVGSLLTAAVVIVTGAVHFNPKIAFDLEPGALHFSTAFFLGLGAAARVGIYDYLGYYDVCYIGEEVKNPGRVIPRSIIRSVVSVALIYFAVNLSINGVISWREYMPFTDANPLSESPLGKFNASVFMERIYGSNIAKAFTLLILWTAFGSVFALLLGYSRIPYAAALDGNFFKIFGRLHPAKNFPSVSLVVMGVISIVASFLSLQTVIDALLTSRILIQFVGQICAVVLLRRRVPASEFPFRMWLYPLPCLVALAGWLFVFLTSGRNVILLSLAMLALGIACFLAWTKASKKWPFAPATPPAT